MRSRPPWTTWPTSPCEGGRHELRSWYGIQPAEAPDGHGAALAGLCALGVGHGGNTVTDVYIDFDMRKVDVANRRVLDYVFYGR